MTIAIVILMCIGYLLICTEHLTRVNKATVALFCGVCGWVMYMCVGPYYVEHQHASAFEAFLNGAPFSIRAVNRYIYDNVFSHHIMELSGIVIYLLATMATVEVLSNNNCFDFITTWCRSRNSKVVTWLLALCSFGLSANIDTLTSAVIMLTLLRQIVINPRQRMLLGAVVVLAANCGGCFTVIGDVTSLIIWTRKAVTPTDYTAALVLPCIVATVIPTYLISKKLPNTIDLKRKPVYYRGDDSSIPVWQRALLLILGILGMWFVPTFYRLTHLPPFLGALCVVGVLWVINEIVNRKNIQSDQPVTSNETRGLQYVIIQMIMFFLGIGLCVNLLIELGAMNKVAELLGTYVPNIYVVSLILGLVSAVMDNVALVISAVSFYPIIDSASATTDYLQNFVKDGSYWYLISLCSTVGGCLLPIGNSAGYALMRSEDVGFWWYVRIITPKVFIGWIFALAVFFGMSML